ncbi:MAG TPA: YIP1 family protein [Anaeromyxobacter sp.]|nr:YIP1 family protein [Anaeromyxobacter sp.]
MNASDLLTDGTVALRTLYSPASALGRLGSAPRAGMALALATLLALAAAAVVVPRTDFGPGQVAVEKKDDGQPAPEPTQFEREQSAATARKLGQVSGWAYAALGPTLLAAGAACALLLGFRTAGVNTSYQPTLAVAAHGMLPLWIGRVLAVPAALLHAPLPEKELAHLLPASPAALLPPDASPLLLGALSGLDLFSLWAVLLVALGMARVTGASRTRALSTTLALYAAYVVVFQVALPSLTARPSPPPP